MNNQIIEQIKEQELTTINKKEMEESIATYLKAKNIDLTKDELKQFMMLCMIYNLNPLKKEIYAIKYNTRKNGEEIPTLEIITNYNEYLKRADATGLLEYSYVEVIKNPKDPNWPLEAIFHGKRKDQSRELTTTCRYIEYTTGKSNWQAKPFFMIEKCAWAKGMRLLFPNELSGMPYINEEFWVVNKQNEDIVKEHMVLENQIKEDKEDIDLSGVVENENNI